MSERQKSCEERIYAEQESREDQAQALFNMTNSDDEEERDLAYDRLYNLALSVEVEHWVKILLSTGGPADWLMVKLEKCERYGWDVLAVEYHHADWFDHAERTVEEGSALWQYAQQICECLEVNGR